MAALAALPPDLLALVVSALSPFDVAEARRVSRALRRALPRVKVFTGHSCACEAKTECPWFTAGVRLTYWNVVSVEDVGFDVASVGAVVKFTHWPHDLPARARLYERASASSSRVYIQGINTRIYLDERLSRYPQPVVMRGVSNLEVDAGTPLHCSLDVPWTWSSISEELDYILRVVAVERRIT